MTKQSDLFLKMHAASQGKRSLELVPEASAVEALLSSPTDEVGLGQTFKEMDTGRTVDTSVPAVDEREVEALLVELGSDVGRKHFHRFQTEIRDTTVRSVLGPLGLGYAVSGLKAFDNKTPGNTTPHFRQGDPRLPTIVLSAPGKNEQDAKKPASGPSGKALKAFIQDRQAKDPETFWSTDEKGYTVTNATTGVEHRGEGGTGRGEAKKSEILDKSNLRRLRREIGPASVVVSLGVNANTAVDALDLPAQRLKGRHPSPLSVNTAPTNGTSDPTGRVKTKKQQWVESVGRSDTRKAPTVVERAMSQAEFAVESGIGMGKQQVIGAVLAEFTIAVSDQIADCFHNGVQKDNQGILKSLAARIRHVAKLVLRKWSVFLEEGLFGVVSGLLGETAAIFARMVMNMTGRFIRIIRQSVMSVLRALKMLVLPPDGWSAAQVLHEATKLIAAGVVVACGIGIEELVAKLVPGSDIIASVVVSLLTGLTTAVVIFGLEKLDLFGANAQQRRQAIFSELHHRDEISAGAIDESFSVFALPNGPIGAT